jgi:hypothetical protein
MVNMILTYLNYLIRIADEISVDTFFHIKLDTDWGMILIGCYG